jgi:hypothetical protein
MALLNLFERRFDCDYILFYQADQLAAIQSLREDQAEADENHAVTWNSAKKGRVSSSNNIIEVSSNTKIPEIAKAARAHAKKYTQGPPLVPAMIVDRILEYVQKARLRKMRECIEAICRYWSLKREARRGAPLLKRLYLEVRSGLQETLFAELMSWYSLGLPRMPRMSKRMRKRQRSSRFVSIRTDGSKQINP